jgi:superfamily I DNA/RNA helicase
MATLKPSPQQKAVEDWIINGTGNALIEAVAGSGKTTTLLWGLKETAGEVAFTAFNKGIALEIDSKVKKQNLGDRVKTGTVHSFGRAAIFAAYPEVVVIDKGGKLKQIAEGAHKNNFVKNFAAKAASYAKLTGIGIEFPISDTQAWVSMVYRHSLDSSLPDYIRLEDAIEVAKGVLKASNDTVDKFIDFDDMIYIPILKNLKMKTYDWVFLDEAQDTNFTRRKLIKQMLNPDGRLVAVGDTHQAVYGFTGADHDSMKKIEREFNTTNLPLTVSYRCPKKVVAVANQWVPHIEADPVSGEGVVDVSYIDDLIKESAFTKKDVIICRKTKPLVELAFKLIRNGIPCKVEGRQIGMGLAALTRKWKVVTVGDLENKLEKWVEREMSKAVLNGDSSRCVYVEDQFGTLKVLINQCSSSAPIKTLTDLIDKFFGDIDNANQDILTLSTIHRSKGKEWNRVFALDMDEHSPSRWAKQDWEIIQEHNLCYVQVTRAKEHLTMLSTSKNSGGGG